MNDYEVSKLKKELQRKQELLKEEREDRESTEKRLVLIQAVTPSPPRNEIASIPNYSSPDRPSTMSTKSSPRTSRK